MKAIRKMAWLLALAAVSAHADERVSAISVTTLAAVGTGAGEIARPLPAYPVSARRSGVHFGRVLLGYNVAADGTVQDVEVLSAHPVQVYTRTAMRSVAQWRYQPGTPDKRMVEFTFMCD